MSDSLIVEPTSTAQWHSLLKDVQTEYSLNLSEDLESYLVFLLMRFTNNAEIARSIFALEYLQSAHKLGSQKRESLRDVGDKCLLFAGLFPGSARRRRVRISYFVKLGQGAYDTLSHLDQNNLAALYNALAIGFIPLMEVLQATRDIAHQRLSLDLLQAEELWSDTGSAMAFNHLKQHSSAKDKLLALFRMGQNEKYH